MEARGNIKVLLGSKALNLGWGGGEFVLGLGWILWEVNAKAGLDMQKLTGEDVCEKREVQESLYSPK